jgi:hypothetical protein
MLRFLAVALFFALSASAAGPFRPYTVVVRESAHDKAGKETLGSRYTEAMRSDGARMSSVQTQKTGALNVTTRVLDLPGGINVQFNDALLLKSTRKVASSEGGRAAQTNCAYDVEKFEGIEALSGYRVAHIRRDGRDSWYAVDYSCAIVRERMGWGDGGWNEKTLVSLTPGEPQPALFANPANFKEVPPSQLWPAQAKGNPKVVSLLDEAYYKQRP